MVTWLDVPIKEKDEAKALGARWSQPDLRWFVPDGVDPAPFRKWLPKPATRKDKAERFREQNLQDSRTVEWQAKQDQIRSRDKYTCRHCKRSTGIMLQIHHRYYLEDKRYWDYPDTALISLCEDCHDREEDALYDAGRDLRRAIAARDGEAKHMALLAEALDKASNRHSISDIISAIDRLIVRDDIIDKIIVDNKSKPPKGS